MTGAGRPGSRSNSLDYLILRGRDPDQPVRLLAFERLRYALLLAILLAVVGSGVIAWTGQQRAKQVCLDRNRAQVVYREALEGLALAAAERGDQRSSAIFRSLAPRTTLPRC